MTDTTTTDDTDDTDLDEGVNKALRRRRGTQKGLKLTQEKDDIGKAIEILKWGANCFQGQPIDPRLIYRHAMNKDKSPTWKDVAFKGFINKLSRQKQPQMRAGGGIVSVRRLIPDPAHTDGQREVTFYMYVFSETHRQETQVEPLKAALRRQTAKLTEYHGLIKPSKLDAVGKTTYEETQKLVDQVQAPRLQALLRPTNQLPASILKNGTPKKT
jgi:hypothetical protein